MKKIILLILLVLFFGGMFLSPEKAESYIPGEVDGSVFIKSIGPKNIVIGKTFGGTAQVSIVCMAVGGQVREKYTKGNAIVSIDFGDGAQESIGSCSCEVYADGEPEVATNVCTLEFSHAYNNIGQYLVTPKANIRNVTFGGEYDVSGFPETIYVAGAASPSTVDNAGNPLIATSAAETVKNVTNVVFWLISGLAIFFIVLGGFFIMTAAGNPKQLDKGRKIISYTIIGFVLMVMAWGIRELIYRILGVNI